MTDITSHALLVGLSVTGLGLISPEVEDKQIGNDVAADHGVSPELVRVMKKLLDRKRFPEVGEVKDAYGELYRYFTSHTLAWGERGVRAVTAAEYLNLTREMQKRREALESAFERLLSRWDEFHDVVKDQLNGMWKESDWPRVETLRSRFSVRIKVRPLVDAEAVKVVLGIPEEIDKIKQQVEEELFRNIHGTLLDLFRRLKDFLVGGDGDRGLLQKLADYEVDQHGKVVGKSFRDSAILNGRELCDIAERLNVTADPTLAGLIGELRSILKANPVDLRDNAVLRADTIRKAQAIAHKLSSIESVLTTAIGAAA